MQFPELAHQTLSGYQMDPFNPSMNTQKCILFVAFSSDSLEAVEQLDHGIMGSPEPN